MNYEVTSNSITELSSDVKISKVIILLLILSIVFIPAAYVLVAAVFIIEALKGNLKISYNKPISLLYAYIAIGLISSQYKIISLFFALIMMLCVYSISIFSTALSIDCLSKIKRYAFSVSLIVFLYGIMQYINPDFSIPVKWIDTSQYSLDKRIYSTFFNPNVFGFYLNFTILLACKNLNTKKFNLDLLVFSSGLICLILTFSRTAWISLITTFIIAGFIDKKYFKYALITAFLIFSTDIILDAGRIDPLKATKDSSIIYRLEIWKATIEITKDNLLSGIGFGTLFKHIGDYSNTVSIKIEHCHNMYLQIFSETGILGFGIITYLIVKILNYFYINIKDNHKQLIIPFTIFIMTMIHGLADSVALTPQIMMILCIYIGIVKGSINT